MRYATSAIQTSQSSTRIVDSTVSQSTGYGIYVVSPVGVPTVTGNTITGAGDDAIVVASASIDMGKLNGNSGSGNGLNGVQPGVGHRDGQLVAAVDRQPRAGHLQWLQLADGSCRA